MHCHSTHTCLTGCHSWRPSKPFLKWAGGKQRLLRTLLPLLPHGERLIEPFVGAGAVSLSTQFSKYLINDANSDLISTWVSLKERPREFVERSQSFFTAENRSLDAYTRIRNEFNLEFNRFERASQLIYLNRFGFNGMYRVNQSGTFNVPYGYPNELPRFPLESLESAALKMERFEVRGGDYLSVLEDAGDGDVLYCDPPYLGKDSRGSSFRYTQDQFDLNDFKRLVAECELAYERGAKVVLSQADSPSARAILRRWVCHITHVQSSIAANTAARVNRGEIIATLR